jgi:potassium channel LctB
LASYLIRAAGKYLTMEALVNPHHRNGNKPGKIGKLERPLYGNAIIKVPFVYLLSLFLIGTLPFVIPADIKILSTISFIISTVTGAYLLGFVGVLVKGSFQRLLSASSISGLFISYFAFLFILVLVFSNVYEISETYGLGYLTYGQCSDNFDPSMIGNDTLRSEEYFYFTGVTLFGVGYGDICPMGWDKNIALLNAFIGNFMFTVVMVLVVTTFLRRIMLQKKAEMSTPEYHQTHGTYGPGHPAYQGEHREHHSGRS